jgi:hypothetical protein
MVVGIDVKGAFLYPELSEEKPIFIQLPKQLTGEPIYWRLKKTLYGLPESPQAFYEDMSRHLKSLGYNKSNYDPCLFFKREGDRILFTVIHVDDFRWQLRIKH